MIGSVRAVVRAWGPAMLWLAVLFILSHQRGGSEPDWWSVPDPVAHLGLYAVLGVTLAWGRRAWGGPGWPALGLFGVVWAMSDEWHQSFVPGREPSAADIAADMAGLVLGGVLAHFAFRILPSSRPGGTTPSIDPTS